MGKTHRDPNFSNAHSGNEKNLDALKDKQIINTNTSSADKRAASTNKIAAESSRDFLKYTSMAFQMIGSILAFVFMGYFIDHSWAKQQLGFPIFTIVGTLLGVAASLYLILKKI